MPGAMICGGANLGVIVDRRFVEFQPPFWKSEMHNAPSFSSLVMIILILCGCDIAIPALRKLKDTANGYEDIAGFLSEAGKSKLCWKEKREGRCGR
jgi:hypothetical protein